MRQSTNLFFTLLVTLCSSRFSSAFMVAPKIPVGPAATSQRTSSLHAKFHVDTRRKTTTTTTTLSLADNANKLEQDTHNKSWSIDPLYAALYIGFIAFATLGPGELGDPKDTALIQNYIDNPQDPGFSEGFQLIFNYLGIMPIIISCLAVPQANNKRGLPPLPFLVASFAMGYGGMGKYSNIRNILIFVPAPCEMKF